MERTKFCNSIELRNKLVNQTNVIDLVESIHSVGDTGYFSVQQVADYFDVKFNTVQKIIQRHNKEFKKDGLVNKSKDEIISMFETDKTAKIEVNRYYTEIKNKKTFMRISNNGILLLNKKSVLRIAMHLTNSKKANDICDLLQDPNQPIQVPQQVKEIEKVTILEPEVHTEENELENLKLAYANFAYSLINNDLESVPAYIQEIRNLEKNKENVYELVEKLQTENQHLKDKLQEAQDFNDHIINKITAGVLIVLMRELNITPAEMIVCIDKILPKQY